MASPAPNQAIDPENGLEAWHAIARKLESTKESILAQDNPQAEPALAILATLQDEYHALHTEFTTLSNQNAENTKSLRALKAKTTDAQIELDILRNKAHEAKTGSDSAAPEGVSVENPMLDVLEELITERTQAIAKTSEEIVQIIDKSSVAMERIQELSNAMTELLARRFAEVREALANGTDTENPPTS